ncbi:HAMP domain-containing histidine kinase [Rubrivivax sp. A210]|uniref:HAMP domain-containing sensor histidine kinase n=1 Tax=Rubrivivax sp. A210 TaxID=2772301 RepID=UPI00191A6B59|nr:HAMP domain-containing sensor histidine kinase [Rubrivivax sp. A210]CAD5371876.1 HAMP domain-containing histidine kinase [Rubrivivax sp. A210]
MRSLYLRIYLTVVAALALFALVSGWIVRSHLEDQRSRVEGEMRERVEAWGDLIERSLPPAGASAEQQVEALRDWSQRLRLPMALDDAAGRRLGASESFARRELDQPGGPPRVQPIRFGDGRTLWVPRHNPRRMPPHMRPPELRPPWLGPAGWPDGLGLAVLLLVLFAAVAGGAWPVVRRLTRRLESLKQGVEAFGAGDLRRRVAEDGQDEVAAVGASFNRAAARIETLLRSHQSLLANASHELRSPLARLKMAVAMVEDAAPAQRAALRQEIATNIRELDALVEEILLSGRLDAASGLDQRLPVDLLALAAEEAARVGGSVQGEDLQVPGDERLLRRALRNLLENARRYGGGEVEAEIARRGDRVEVRVLDRGPGVPEAWRERVFEAFFRLPGHAEREGGVGLGLSLVRQIAERHGGSVVCEAREGGGSCFVLSLPAEAGPP